MTIWARDPVSEAFLREQVRAGQYVQIVERSAPDVEGAIIQADLLTFTEKRVLRAFFRHDRVKEVAEELYIASDTVKKHLKHIYQKLGVYSSHRALVKAMELGLLGDGDGDSIKG